MSAPTFEPPTPNLPLLRKVLDHIDAHPEEHNQAAWGYEDYAETECGTAMCVAGWAMYFAGEPMRGEHGNGYAISDAARVIGLTVPESIDLFLNTISGLQMRTVADCHDLPERERIQLVAETIAARAGERL